MGDIKKLKLTLNKKFYDFKDLINLDGDNKKDSEDAIKFFKYSLSNNLDNSKRKKAASNDKINNNKKRAIKISRQFFYPNKIINNSININMINYITNNSSQQMPSIIKNNNYINNNNSFSVSNSNYEPYYFFNKGQKIGFKCR